MKGTVYGLIVDIWRMISRYQFRRLNDAEWEAFLAEGIEGCIKYQKQGPVIERLYRDLFSAAQEFYKSLGTDVEHGR